MSRIKFRSPVVFPFSGLESDLSGSVLVDCPLIEITAEPATILHPVIYSQHICSVSTVKVENVPLPAGDFVHVKFAVRMSNKDTYTASLGTLPEIFKEEAIEFLNNERLRLICNTQNPCSVLFQRGGLL